jgi:hypothetical protein
MDGSYLQCGPECVKGRQGDAAPEAHPQARCAVKQATCTAHPARPGGLDKAGRQQGVGWACMIPWDSWAGYHLYVAYRSSSSQLQRGGPSWCSLRISTTGSTHQSTVQRPTTGHLSQTQWNADSRPGIGGAFTSTPSTTVNTHLGTRACVASQQLFAQQARYVRRLCSGRSLPPPELPEAAQGEAHRQQGVQDLWGRADWGRVAQGVGVCVRVRPGEGGHC